MFKNTNGKTEVSTNVFNTITSGTNLKGDIITQNDIRIDGNLEGTLETKGKLVIGQSGSIKGDIICQNAEIYGGLIGKIKASELISLKASAKVNGEMVTAKLSIEPGANFNGNCNMGAVIKDMKLGETREDNKSKERTA